MRTILFPLALFLFTSGYVQGIPCQNGGFFNGTGCNCPPLWTGPNCENITCLNGGYSTAILGTIQIAPTPSSTDSTSSPADPISSETSSGPERCICPSGYLGVHCDAVTTVNPPLNFFPKKKVGSNSSKMKENTFNLVFINLFSYHYGGLAYSQFNLALRSHLEQSNYEKYNLLTTGEPPSINAPKICPTDSNQVDSSFSNNSTLTLPSFQTPGQYCCYKVPYLEGVRDSLIYGQELRDTAITIFTQHPPSNDSATINKIIELSRSFNIRINVIWSDDPTFVRCNNSTDLEILQQLADKTGGLFVTVVNEGDYTTNNTIMDVVLATHYLYEPVTMAFNNNGITTISFNMNLPNLKNYYIVATGVKDQNTTTTSGCPALASGSTITSANNIVVYTTNSYLGTGCTVRSTEANKVQVFGTKYASSGPVSVNLYKSYVEHPSLDTSNVQPNPGNLLFFSLHVEPNGLTQATVTQALYYEGTKNSTNLNLISRDSSLFEYISSNPFNCSGISPAWIELTIRGAVGVPEKRYIPVYCEPKPSLSTSEAFFELSEGSENDDFISFAQTIPTPTPTYPTPKSFILAYSDVVNPVFHDAFILGAISLFPSNTYNSSFADVLFDITTDLNNSSVQIQTNFSDFNQAVLSTNGYDPAKAPNDNRPSQVYDALNKIILAFNSNHLNQNSIIGVNLGRLPSNASEDLRTYYPLVHKNVKVVFFVGNSSVKNELPGRSTDTLVQIAAITSGHFIAYDDTDRNGFKSVVGTVFQYGPAQNLLLAKNLLARATPAQTVFGTIDLTKVNGSITVYVTMSTYVSADGTNPLAQLPPVLLGFSPLKNCSTEPITVNMTRQGNTNFYLNHANLTRGCLYSFKSQMPILTSNPVFIRVWSLYDNIDVQSTYYDLSNNVIATPNTSEGASLGTKLEGSTTENNTLTMRLSDCTGNQIKLFDNYQENVLVNNTGYTRFVPFFCTIQNSSNCPPGTENLYYAQLTSNDGYISTKSFICEQGGAPEPNCNHTDSNGNFICSGSSEPYVRGPTGKLIDCSGQTLLYGTPVNSSYAPFKCNCSDDQGSSCASASCTNPNQKGGAIDSFYRTYTVILGIDRTNADSNLPSVIEDAQKTLAPDNQNFPNIWLYQLLVQCNSGEQTTIYIGTDYVNFRESFNSIPKTSCNTSDYSTPFDLTPIYSTALKAVGREQRGLIVYYTEAIGANNYRIDVTKEDFIELAQQYRQELYVFNYYTTAPPTTVTNDLIESIMSTGGTFIAIDYNTYDTDQHPTLTDFFINILPVATSFNAHSTNGTSVTINVEKKGYLIIGSNEPLSSEDNTTLSKYCDSNGQPESLMSPYGIVCSINKDVSPQSIQINTSVWYSVVSLAADGSAPRGIFIEKRTDDSQTAVAVNYTTGGPTFAVYLPNFDGPTSEDKNARSATRGCTYNFITVNAFQALNPGYNNFKIGVTSESKPYTKVFPFGVSSNIACQNGTVNSGFGQCTQEKDWEGPDNSRPKCRNGGVLSTWSNACNCFGTYGGRFCEIDLSLTTASTSPAPGTTAVPASTYGSSPAISASTISGATAIPESSSSSFVIPSMQLDEE